LVVTFGKGRVPDSAVLAGVAPEIGLRVTMTLVGMASGPATDGLALVAEGAVSGWSCRLRATLGFMEEQESGAARSLLVRCERALDASDDALFRGKGEGPPARLSSMAR